MADEQEYMTVRITDAVPEGRVVMWERDDAHPDGEIYIAKPSKEDQKNTVNAEVKANEFQVGDTAFVHEKIRNGELEEVKQSSAKATSSEEKTATTTAKKE